MEGEMTAALQTRSGLEQFITATHALFAAESDLEKRWQALRPIL